MYLYIYFACAKTKAQISCAVAAQLTSAFVSIIPLPLNPKFQATSHLLWLYSLVCVTLGPLIYEYTTIVLSIRMGIFKLARLLNQQTGWMLEFTFIFGLSHAKWLICL